MQAAGRNISDLDLCDIVKDNALSIHASWSSLVDPLVTTRDELEDLIYNRGVHLEEKVAASQLEKSGPIAFLATSKANEEFRILQEQLAALSAEFRNDRRGGRGGRGGRGSRKNSIEGTRTCYGCGKKGHIRPNCPDLHKSNADQPQKFGGAICAFPASGRLYHEKYYNASTTWDVDSGASRHF